MTRPLPASEAFVARLPDRLRDRVDVIVSPLLSIVSTDQPPDMGAQEAAIFTSANGVAHGPDGQGRTAYCVGPATTRRAQARGWTAQQSGETAEDLLHTLLANLPDQPLVHLSGTHIRGDITGDLTRAGAQARHVPVYDQQLRPLTQAAKTALRGDRPVIVPLFSPRTAQHFFDNAPSLHSAKIIAISDAVAACAPPGLHSALRIAEAPNADAMTKALTQMLKSRAFG